MRRKIRSEKQKRREKKAPAPAFAKNDFWPLLDEAIQVIGFDHRLTDPLTLEDNAPQIDDRVGIVLPCMDPWDFPLRPEDVKRSSFNQEVHKAMIEFGGGNDLQTEQLRSSAQIYNEILSLPCSILGHDWHGINNTLNSTIELVEIIQRSLLVDAMAREAVAYQRRA
jgi:hypothetical protein